MRCERTLIVVVAMAMLASTAGAVPPVGTPEPNAGPTSYIVGFYELPSDVKVGGSYMGGTVLRLDEALVFAVVETSMPPLFVLQAQQDDRVRYVEWDDPAFGVVTFVPNDARYSDAGHYGSKKIGAEKAWDRTRGTTAVKVSVIDTGLLKTHEEFAGQSRVLQGWDFVNNDNNPNDDCGHGTHVTGTIGATINNGKGIAGLAQVAILPTKGLSAVGGLISVTCSGSTSALASSLSYAGDQGAHISSNSWGGGTSTALNDAITYAYNKGVTIVAAAGNDGSCTNCVSEPWKTNAAKVIVVSSTDSADALSSFSSQGPQVDVAAPGSNILSSYNGGATSYSTLSGTSMATPHVAGALALVKTLNPSFGFADLDNRIKTTAVDLGTAGKDDKFGYGRINADAATAGGTPPPPPPNNPPTASFTHSETGLTTSVNGGASSDSDGTIVSWSWNWGDGTPAGSGATASHTYASAGTRTVTLTVTDDDGATATQSQSVTVSTTSDPDPSTPNLSNGVLKSDTSGASGTWKYYKIQVPAGRPSLTVVLDGPACSGLLGCSPDLDLYVKRAAKPTTSVYDCRPYATGSDETCTQSNPAADWWYVGVNVYSGSSVAYTIRATY